MFIASGVGELAGVALGAAVGLSVGVSVETGASVDAGAATLDDTCVGVGTSSGAGVVSEQAVRVARAIMRVMVAVRNSFSTGSFLFLVGSSIHSTCRHLIPPGASALVPSASPCAPDPSWAKLVHRDGSCPGWNLECGVGTGVRFVGVPVGVAPGAWGVEAGVDGVVVDAEAGVGLGVGVSDACVGTGLGAAIAGVASDVASGVGELAVNAVVAASCPGPVDIQTLGVHLLSCLSENLSIGVRDRPAHAAAVGVGHRD